MMLAFGYSPEMVDVIVWLVVAGMCLLMVARLLIGACRMMWRRL